MHTGFKFSAVWTFSHNFVGVGSTSHLGLVVLHHVHFHEIFTFNKFSFRFILQNFELWFFLGLGTGWPRQDWHTITFLVCFTTLELSRCLIHDLLLGWSSPLSGRRWSLGSHSCGGGCFFDRFHSGGFEVRCSRGILSGLKLCFGGVEFFVNFSENLVDIIFARLALFFDYFALLFILDLLKFGFFIFFGFYLVSKAIVEFVAKWKISHGFGHFCCIFGGIT